MASEGGPVGSERGPGGKPSELDPMSESQHSASRPSAQHQTPCNLAARGAYQKAPDLGRLHPELTAAAASHKQRAGRPRRVPQPCAGSEAWCAACAVPVGCMDASGQQHWPLQARCNAGGDAAGHKPGQGKAGRAGQGCARSINGPRRTKRLAVSRGRPAFSPPPRHKLPRALPLPAFSLVAELTMPCV